MTDLSTTYLGLKLRSPLVASSSVLSAELDDIKRLEQAGAGALVLFSLFEEEMLSEEYDLHRTLEQGANSSPEALSYFPDLGHFGAGPDRYLKHLQETKRAVRMPVIASLNGSSKGGWTAMAKRMEAAGADAIELNIYSIPADVNISGGSVEKETLELFQSVKSTVKIPVAVKLSPYFSSMANMAKQLSDSGADGLVLFNRFYQPDLDLESREVSPRLLLSTPMAFRLPLRWIAILYGRVKSDLAATSGIFSGDDALKVIMAGASVTMLCSTLLRNGIGHLRTMENDMRRWMEAHEYGSVEQMKGSVSQKNCDDPKTFERAQYIKTLRSFKPEQGSFGTAFGERWEV